MRSILDTNIVMSGIFWAGHARDILLLLEEGQFEHICSKEIVEEYFATAKKLKNKLKREDRSVMDEILDMVVMRSHFGQAVPASGPLCRDPNDQMFLDLAVSAEARYIVSGDKDLLTVENYPGGSVIKPKPFLDLF
jgi:putative PIN family toxin of toxin-antitoxin system